MAAQTGTFAAGDSGITVRDVIHATLGLHANWEFIEDYTAVSGVVYRIWKCKAAGNAAATDFHVALSGAGIEYWVRAFEGWNTTTKLASKPVTNTNTTVEADGSLAGTFGIEDSGVFPVYDGIYPAFTTASTYACLVDANRLIMSITYSATAGQGTGLYVGLIESLLDPADDPMPLVSVWGSAYLAGIFGGASRHPLKLSSGADNWAFRLPVPTTAEAVYGYACPVNPINAAWSQSFWGAGLLGRATVISKGARGSYGGLRGILRGVGYSGLITVASANVSTITVSGVTYRAINLGYIAAQASTSSYYWASEAD